MARKTHAVRMTKSCRHVDNGRDACVAAHRLLVTPLRRYTAKYTPRGTLRKGPRGRKNHVLTPEERLEFFQEYSKWIKEGRKRGKPPIPHLKRKYKACQHSPFFTRLVQRQFETGTTSPSKPPGRSPAPCTTRTRSPVSSSSAWTTRGSSRRWRTPHLSGGFCLVKGSRRARRRGRSSTTRRSAFLIKSGVFREVHKALKRLCKPNQAPFFIQGHVRAPRLHLHLRRVDVPGRKDARLERRRRGCVPVHEAYMKYLRLQLTWGGV